MEKWWLEKPMRMVQTNLREIDACLNLDEYMRRLKEFSAEVVLFNTGGIVANYPTNLPFHFRNPHLKDDLVGKVLARAHREGMRFMARFDFSKVNQRIAAEHPDWLYMSVEGRSVNYNGQVHACVNGRYQQECALEILGEALDRYDVDGIFFNMIGYQTHDYSGNYFGVCQCGNCRERFRADCGEDLPRKEDPADPAFRRYEAFRRDTSRELFWKVTNFIKARRPDAAICTGTHEGVDIYRKESNTGLNRALPEWNHSASDNVKSVLGSWENMPAANTAVHFIDFPCRHSAVSPHLTHARLAGDLISGGWIDYYVIGTLEGQDDRLCYEGAKDVFAFHRRHEKWFTGTKSKSDALIIDPAGSRMYGAGKEYRGLFRMLTEGHVLFDVMDDSVLSSARAPERLKAYRLVVLPDARNLSDTAVKTLDNYVAEGGKLLASGFPASCDKDGNPAERIRLVSLGVKRVVARHPHTPGAYLRIRPEDKRELKGFENLDILYLDGELEEFELAEGSRSLLGLIPNSMYGPPEKCYYTRETGIPGLIASAHGRGRCALLPWNPGRQYVKLSHPGLLRLTLSAIEDVLGMERGVTVRAPALVEVSAHVEKQGRWTWVGLLNHSGQLGTAFHAPVPVSDIHVGIRTGHRPVRARALRAGKNLVFRARRKGWVEFRLPRLDLYEVIVVRLKK